MTTKECKALSHEAADYIEHRQDHRPVEELTLACALTGLKIPNGPVNFSAPDLSKLRKRLAIALKRERGKARAGSSKYSFSRHLVLHRIMKKLVRDGTTARRSED